MTNKERIIDIYKRLDRSYFLDDLKEQSHLDTPLPIGHGQTISQPSLVLKMTIALEVEESHSVLEIGTGSGYQTALLSQAAHKVYTIERIEELYKSAKARLDAAGYTNISFKLGDGSLGWEENAPYDRIMVTAGAARMPEDLVDQLAENGRMVIPVGSGSVQELKVITKDSKGEIHEETIEKVRFVRLIGDY